ncbi:4702_t:CDS:2 [Acaulospora colombiana]|uniref:4702_t:CDS:1 n=1 Tax=Acaulospora colombiana TaxID=27376 RepID=A0ACA9LQ10_9GLOM|nr:4702_t:CDS:2 [Acaulospora colombiana]
MSPLAFIQTVIYAYVTGELHRVRVFSRTEMTSSLVFALVTNGVIAFFLNVVSFTANKKTSALTMTVAVRLSKEKLSVYIALKFKMRKMDDYSLSKILFKLPSYGTYGTRNAHPILGKS